jgi:hypothetical protein
VLYLSYYPPDQKEQHYTYSIYKIHARINKKNQ